jgi:hypothetical protein
VLSGQVKDLGQVRGRHYERSDKSSDLRKLLHDVGFPEGVEVGMSNPGEEDSIGEP